MGRPVVLGNGHILVGLDDFGTVHDFYYPYVGLENLTTARFPNHKIGVWTAGKFSWIDDGSWDISLDFEQDALVSDITAANQDLQVKLHFNDFVDTRYPAFCRLISITNESDKNMDVRLFMHQAFQVSRSGRSDTALFIPKENYILDYKGWSSLLIYGRQVDGEPFDQFAVGNHGIEGKEGTFRDAEDGELSGSLVEHGSVDSTLRMAFHLKANETASAEYWVVASDSQFDAEAIHHVLLNKSLKSRLAATRQAWRDWLAIGSDKLDKVDEKYKELAKKSLLIIKAHTDKHGGIIASSDSSIYNYGRDYYCYVWPRDGAYTLLPLIELGYTEEPKKFFDFCADTIHPRGYMMHKYQPDRAVGSTWHPQLHFNHPELPIQEDETAIILYVLDKYLNTSSDKAFIQGLYKDLIKPAADFLAGFVDEATALPHASYDLWEERFATHTYTVFVTRAGLAAAAAIAGDLGSHTDQEKWSAAANKIDEGMELLYADGYYRKSVLLKPNGDLEFDNTLDSSSGYGALLFDNGQSPEDRLSSTMEAVEQKLLNSSSAGGVPRYEHDNYFIKDSKYIGNPWIITTLWLAQYFIKTGDRQKAVELMDWAAAKAGPSGMFAEQADPETGAPVGVNPLVWSHSTFLETALMLSSDE